MSALGDGISRDPLEELGGVNLYVAFYSNPLNYVDRNGLDNWGDPSGGQNAPPARTYPPTNLFDPVPGDTLEIWTALMLDNILGPPQFTDDDGNMWAVYGNGTIAPGYLEAGLNLGRLARCCRFVGLGAHEGGWWKGHTLAKHVGKDAVWLRARAMREGLPYASSFFSREIAEHAIATTIRQNGKQILSWLAGKSPGTSITSNLRAEVGIVVRASPPAVLKGTRVTVVLRRDGCGYRIVTIMLNP